MTHQEALIKAARAYVPPTMRMAIEYLEEQPATMLELAAHLGMTGGSAYDLIVKMKALKIACVVDFQAPTGSRGGNRINVYGLGSKDIKVPAKPGAQRQRESRERKKMRDGGVRLGAFGL